MSDSFLAKVEASIDRMCNELKLTPFVRAKCIEMSKKRAMPQDENSLDADGIACAIVSIEHEEARRNGRVSRHLPNKMIGKVLGMDSGSVVHNIHLFNSRKQ
jgi:hypothetical protein